MSLTTPRFILLVFVDGLGIGPPDPAANPLYGDGCPHLLSLMDDHATPIDACLGVPGLPQSATGQTTLLTGVNAAARMGRHIEGFPGPGLCRIIRENNIFAEVVASGRRATFSNGYLLDRPDEAPRLRLRSVTTVATLSAFGCVRDRGHLDRREAVAHDLTRASLRDRGYAGPLLSESQAASDLATVARTHAFTLFEFFLTDRAGHTRDAAQARTVLSRLDRFLESLSAQIRDDDALLVLTSDHGNVEDLSTRLHTRNPVPLVAVGPGADELRSNVRSLADVTPALLRLFA